METNSSTVNFGKVSLQNGENCSFAMKQIIYIESLLKVFLPRAQLTTLKFRILSINTSHHNILPNCKTQSPMHGPTAQPYILILLPSLNRHPSIPNLSSTSININKHLYTQQVFSNNGTSNIAPQPHLSRRSYFPFTSY